MTPEVQATTIIVANEWAILLTKLSPPIKGQFLDHLASNFRTTYQRVHEVVKEVGAISG